jgi:hypothetical protein
MGVYEIAHDQRLILADETTSALSPVHRERDRTTGFDDEQRPLSHGRRPPRAHAIVRGPIDAQTAVRRRTPCRTCGGPGEVPGDHEGALVVRPLKPMKPLRDHSSMRGLRARLSGLGLDQCYRWLLRPWLFCPWSFCP